MVLIFFYLTDDDEGILLETYCGFEGQFKFNGTYGGQQCLGMISDKDPDTCNTVATLTLRSKDCLGITGVKRKKCLETLHQQWMIIGVFFGGGVGLVLLYICNSTGL